MQQGRGMARIFWRPGPLLTMATPNINYKLKKKKQLFVKFPHFQLRNDKSDESRDAIFYLNICFVNQVAAPSTVLPRTAMLL